MFFYSFSIGNWKGTQGMFYTCPGRLQMYLILFHLILKVLKLVLNAIMFSDCSKYGFNWRHFTCEICLGSIYLLVVPPTSIVVISASVVPCFTFAVYSDIDVWITPSWDLICGGHGIFDQQSFLYFQFIYFLFFSVFLWFYFPKFLIFCPF